MRLAIAIEHCPSLKRDLDRGTLEIRQVFRHRVQLAILAPQAFIEIGVPVPPDYPATPVTGHAKVELLKWAGRDLEWLMR